MTVGENKITKMLLNMLGNDTINIVDDYINDVCSRNFIVINSLEQENKLFNDSVENFLSSLSVDDLLNLRSYTGYNFRNINEILRGNWNYNANGRFDEKKRKNFVYWLIG